MPTPSRTSLERIVSAAGTILEASGIDSLTMQAVADAVGVRAPSLYRHVHNRSDLIRQVANRALGELADTLDAAASSGDPRRDLVALAGAYRAFARSRPETYRLLFRRPPADQGIDPALNVRASEAIMRIAGELAGREHALEAARTAVAWAHGFVSMELADAFRLGGDVEAAYAYGTERLAVALASGAGTPRA